MSVDGIKNCFIPISKHLLNTRQDFFILLDLLAKGLIVFNLLLIFLGEI